MLISLKQSIVLNILYVIFIIFVSYTILYSTKYKVAVFIKML